MPTKKTLSKKELIKRKIIKKISNSIKKIDKSISKPTHRNPKKKINESLNLIRYVDILTCVDHNGEERIAASQKSNPVNGNQIIEKFIFEHDAITDDDKKAIQTMANKNKITFYLKTFKLVSTRTRVFCPDINKFDGIK